MAVCLDVILSFVELLCSTCRTLHWNIKCRSVQLCIVLYSFPKVSPTTAANPVKSGPRVIRGRDSPCAAAKLAKRGHPVTWCGVSGILWVGPTVRLDTLPPLFAFI